MRTSAPRSRVELVGVGEYAGTSQRARPGDASLPHRPSNSSRSNANESLSRRSKRDGSPSKRPRPTTSASTRRLSRSRAAVGSVSSFLSAEIRLRPRQRRQSEDANESGRVARVVAGVKLASSSLYSEFGDVRPTNHHISFVQLEREPVPLTFAWIRIGEGIEQLP